MKTLIFLLCVTLVWCSPKPKKNKIKPCVYIKYDSNLNDGSEPNGKCNKNKICELDYTSTKINVPPYSEHEVIRHVFEHCCKCKKDINVTTLRNLSEVNDEIFRKTDFVYPVIGPTEKLTVYGLHFIPIYDVTDYYYITAAPPKVFQRMMRTMEKVYPLLVLCILMTSLSGFITWLIETKDNKEDFPRPFLIGWFEGTWWSFISMTTVGYGDKTPKTVTGRIFAVFWILIGITMFGILTGLITAAIQESETPTKPTMKDKNVGVLKYRTLDISFLAASGGIAKQTKAKSVEEDIIQLMSWLRNKKVDGILLDKPTYNKLRYECFLDLRNKTKHPWMKWVQNESSLTIDEIQASTSFFQDSVATYLYPYTGERMSYGILAKDERINDYLRDAILDNRMIMKANDSLKRNGVQNSQKDYDLFDIKSPYFHTAMIVLLVLLAVAALIGFTVEKSKLFCFTNRVNTEPK